MMDFVWVFHKIRHEALPTQRKVHKYKQTQPKEANNLNLEQQEDEVLPAKMKYLKTGKAQPGRSEASICNFSEYRGKRRG